MNRLMNCLKKDRREFIRGKKNLLCLSVLLGCAFLVLLSTLSLPYLLDKAIPLENIFFEDSSFSEFMGKFFPNDLKGSLGIFAADVGIFYSLTIILMTYTLIPDEISSAKIVLPLCSGYHKKDLLISKELTYSILISVPVFMIYMLYFYIGSTILECNFDIRSAFGNAISLALGEFMIAAITIVLSTIFKNKYMALVCMVSIILIVPDVMFYFNFGQYFPTYLLTYAYNSSQIIESLIIPIAGAWGLLILLNIIAFKKSMLINIDDRR